MAMDNCTMVTMRCDVDAETRSPKLVVDLENVCVQDLFRNHAIAMEELFGKQIDRMKAILKNPGIKYRIYLCYMQMLL